jgi:hypothetical protein
MLLVEDPALTLMHSNGMVFLAVVRLLDICIDSVSTQRLPLHLLHELNVRAHAQVLSLACTDVSHQPDGPDWEWTGLFEAGAGNSGLCDIEGNWVDVINPVVQARSWGSNIGTTTYAFCTAELRAMAAILYEWLKQDIHCLPTLSSMDTFPYQFE